MSFINELITHNVLYHVLYKIYKNICKFSHHILSGKNTVKLYCWYVFPFSRYTFLSTPRL